MPDSESRSGASSPEAESPVQRYNALLARLGQEQERLERLTREHGVANELLQQLSIRRVVAKREFQLLQNELYRLRLSLAGAETRLEPQKQAYRRVQELVRGLRADRQTLDRRLAEIAPKADAQAKRLEALKREVEEQQDRLAALEESKLQLVSEIAQRLTRASLDGERIEAELNDVAMRYRDMITQRDAIQGEVVQGNAALEGARQEVAALAAEVAGKRRIFDLLAELAKAQADRDRLRMESEESQAALRHGQAERDARQARLVVLEAELTASVAAADAQAQRLAVCQRAQDAAQAAQAALTASESEVGALEAGLEAAAQELLVLDGQRAAAQAQVVRIAAVGQFLR
uniref:Magnetosome protein Mad21 n=1 Tax=bacterium FH-1 TaxID=1297054 RepID=M1RVI3_UNCXX|nr:magnetosome protein Mad21 [bacterium FH-1]